MEEPTVPYPPNTSIVAGANGSSFAGADEPWAGGFAGGGFVALAAVLGLAPFGGAGAAGLSSVFGVFGACRALFFAGGIGRTQRRPHRVKRELFVFWLRTELSLSAPKLRGRRHVRPLQVCDWEQLLYLD